MCAEAKLLRLCPFNPEVNEGIVEGLLDSQVRRSGHVSDFLEQLIGPKPIAGQVIPHDLNVYRSGEPKIQNLRDNVGRQERKDHAGKLLGQAHPKLLNIIRSWMMLGSQGDEDVRIRGANWSRVAVRKIDAAVWQSDIVDDAR